MDHELTGDGPVDQAEKGHLADSSGATPRSLSGRLASGALEALHGWGRHAVRADRLHGGTTASTLRIHLDDGTTAVLKQSRRAPEDLWSIEAEGLQALRVAGGPAVPEVLAHGKDFLLIEDFGHPIPDSDSFWVTFGHQLATMHQVTGQGYGWHSSTMLALIRQDNTWTEDGWEFFGEHRLLAMLRLENVEAALAPEDRSSFDRVIARLPDLVPAQPPSLVHGDLWRSNVLAADADSPALCDPAVSYTWAEVDISMLWCSGGVPECCFDAYQEIRPIEGDWRERMPLLHLRENLSVLAHIGYDEATVAQVRDVLERFG